MSSVTNDSSIHSPSHPDLAPRRVPTLNQLREMTSEPGERVVIRGVDWAFYEQLLDSIPEDEHIHVDYDGKDIEMMVIGFGHDFEKKLLSQFVESVAQELEIPYKSAGQTTWKRPEVNRGLEADDCYFFRSDKLAAIAAAWARGARKVADYPNPDLAIEIDDSRSKIDRPGIYAALRIPEVWRFENNQVFIDRLKDDGTYEVVDASQFLPVTAIEIRRWVVEENSEDDSSWSRRLRAWVRDEVVPRRAR